MVVVVAHAAWMMPVNVALRACSRKLKHSPAKHWRGTMTDYMQTLLNICFTMVTGVVIMGSLGFMVFLALLLLTMIKDEFM
jgi:hypothetical protein